MLTTSAIKKTDPSHVLGIDLGTTLMKAVLFDFSSPDKNQVIGVAKTEWEEPTSSYGLPINKNAIVAGLNKIILELNIPANTPTIFSLSGGWLLDFTTVAKITRPNSQDPITEQELSEICSRLEDAAGVEAAGQVGSFFGNPDAYLELISSDISLCKLDDYYVSNPLSYRGGVMELSLYTSFSPSHYLDFIKKISREIRLDLKTVVSSFDALLKSIKLQDKSQFNGIFIDVGGLTTNIAIVIGGGVVNSSSFPIGDWHFTNQLCSDLSIDFSIAHNVRYHFDQQDLPVSSEKINESLTRTSRYWAGSFESVLESFAGVKKFPHQIFMIGGGCRSPEIQAILSDSRWLRRFPFSQEVELSSLTFEDLEVADLTGKLVGNEFILPACLGSLREVFVTKLS